MVVVGWWCHNLMASEHGFIKLTGALGVCEMKYAGQFGRN